MQLDPSFAEQLVRAERELVSAHTTYNVAAEQHRKIQARYAALTTEREQIIADRTNGEISEQHEMRLAVIAADFDGLRPLITAAEAELNRLDVTPKRERLEYTQRQWTYHQDQVQFALLDTRMRTIETLYIQSVAALHEQGKTMGRRHLQQCYRASKNMQNLITFGTLPLNR